MVDIRFDIRDDTSWEGLQPQAVRMWQAVVRGAHVAGLSELVVTAGHGGGHLSHHMGTEIDFLAYNADGSLATPQQRLVLAAAAASVGANRFGFYDRGLHFGMGYFDAEAGVMRQNAVWGPGGRVRDVGIGEFHPILQDFARHVRAGEIDSYLTNVVPTLSFAADDGLFTPEQTNAFRQVHAQGPYLTEAIATGRTLRRGERGQDVRDLQAFLNQQGVRDDAGRSLEEDGVFGPLTEQAVRRFQSQQSDLVVDGIVGPRTFRAIEESVTGVAMPAPVELPNPVEPPTLDTLSRVVGDDGRMLRAGSRGDPVRELQAYLNYRGFTDAEGGSLAVDGVFGERTRHAVRQFQEAEGLQRDGIVGPRTLERINRPEAAPGIDLEQQNFGERYTGPSVTVAPPGWAPPSERLREFYARQAANPAGGGGQPGLRTPDFYHAKFGQGAPTAAEPNIFNALGAEGPPLRRRAVRPATRVLTETRMFRDANGEIQTIEQPVAQREHLRGTVLETLRALPPDWQTRFPSPAAPPPAMLNAATNETRLPEFTGWSAHEITNWMVNNGVELSPEDRMRALRAARDARIRDQGAAVPAPGGGAGAVEDNPFQGLGYEELEALMQDFRNPLNEEDQQRVLDAMTDIRLQEQGAPADPGPSAAAPYVRINVGEATQVQSTNDFVSYYAKQVADASRPPPPPPLSDAQTKSRPRVKNLERVMRYA